MPRAARRALLVVAGLLVALGVSQLLLPTLAEDRLRSRLEADGQVRSVTVSAFPALKLLWGRADRVVVRMADAGAGPGRLADLLASTSETDELDARVTSLRVLTLRFHDLTLRKRGRDLSGTATVTGADLRAALPGGFDVRPVASGNGALVFQGTATLLGRRLSAQAVVAARNGRVLLAPNVPFGGFLSLTVFDDPRIEVLDVGARARPDGFVLTARARLRQ